MAQQQRLPSLQWWTGPRSSPDSSWPPHVLTHLPLEQRLGGLLIGQAALGVYLYVLGPRASPGLPRLAVCLPAIVALALACLLFDSQEEVLPRTSAIFLCGWLGTHKVSSKGGCLLLQALSRATTTKRGNSATHAAAGRRWWRGR